MPYPLPSHYYYYYYYLTQIVTSLATQKSQTATTVIFLFADLLEKIADEIQILGCCNPLFVQIKLTDEIELLEFGRQYI